MYETIAPVIVTPGMIKGHVLIENYSVGDSLNQNSSNLPRIFHTH